MQGCDVCSNHWQHKPTPIFHGMYFLYQNIQINIYMEIRLNSHSKFPDPHWLFKCQQLSCYLGIHFESHHSDKKTTSRLSTLGTTRIRLTPHVVTTWRNNNVIMTSRDVATSFWRNDDVIIASRVRRDVSHRYAMTIEWVIKFNGLFSDSGHWVHVAI